MDNIPVHGLNFFKLISQFYSIFIVPVKYLTAHHSQFYSIFIVTVKYLTAHQ